MIDSAPPPEPAADSLVDLLLATKLYVPRPPPALLLRPRLVELLSHGLAGRLTLIAAPAGWGKTTLLGAWRAETTDSAIALAWVSLDPPDNDPTRFWTYVVAALQTAHPTIGASTRALLCSPYQPSLQAILTTLLNELAPLSAGTILVLDDYHAIESATIHESLAFFLDHLPPHVHMVIATRADPPLPLARWRARRAMVEIRADDLRFTNEETNAFLSQTLAAPLDSATVAALAERTEGWIAGLQLAALAMRDLRDCSAFVSAFRGSHRFVADYLAEEVFQRQPAPLQDFLLRTAILDRMCAPLCQALGDDLVSTSGAQLLLEQLDRANLFLIPLDGERRWYRYHHLFADLLRARLQQEHSDRVWLLHRRASEWFERSGLFAEAIQHALAAGDVARAADLLELTVDPLLVGGQTATVHRWLAQLPASILRSHPRLLLSKAETVHLLDVPRPEALETILHETEAALDASDPTQAGASPAIGAGTPERLAAKIAAIRALQVSEQGDTGQALALARTALDRLSPDDALWRLLALRAVGMAHILRGEAGDATRALAEVIRVAEAAGASLTVVGSRFWLATLCVIRGKLREAKEQYQQIIDQVRGQGGEGAPLNAGLLIGLGIGVDYERNDLANAEHHLEEGIRLADRTQWPWVLVDACATLARIKSLRGEGLAVPELLRRADQHAQTVEVPWSWMGGRLAASMARAYLAFGQVERAAEWAARFDASRANDLEYSTEIQHITAARLLLAQGQGSRALAELDPLVPRAELTGRWGRVIEMQTLRAVALSGLGRREEGLAALAQALTHAEPEGYVRSFIDQGPPILALLATMLQHGRAPAYVATLIRAFGKEPLGPPPAIEGPASAPIVELPPAIPLLEALSERERDVLRLLVAGRSAPEIAEALVVAPSTVRTHLKSIYGKLSVHSRVQAVLRARELKLV